MHCKVWWMRYMYILSQMKVHLFNKCKSERLLTWQKSKSFFLYCFDCFVSLMSWKIFWGIYLILIKHMFISTSCCSLSLLSSSNNVKILGLSCWFCFWTLSYQTFPFSQMNGKTTVVSPPWPLGLIILHTDGETKYLCGCVFVEKRKTEMKLK